MNLLKTTFLTALSTAVKILANLIGNKIIALYVGPAGLAQIGQFANLTNLLVAFAGGGVNVGVTKYIAEYRARQADVAPLLATALSITILCSLVVATIAFWLRNELSRWLLDGGEYGGLMMVMAFMLAPIALNGLLLAVLNGYKEVRLLVGISMVSSLIGLAAMVFLTISSGLNGALLALVLGPAASFFWVLIYILKKTNYPFKHLFSFPDRVCLNKLGRFAIMALASAVSLPLALMIVRDHLGQTLSWQAAGYWQGIWKISEAYLLLVTTSLSVYYLPRLSEIQERHELRREILQGYKILLPIVITAALGIYFCREWIVRLLFSAEFMPMTELFAFQMLGDVLKIGAWILAYLMLAKVMPGTFIMTEIAFSACFVGLSFLLVERFGLIGVTYAFALSYLLYWLMLIGIFRGYLRPILPKATRT